MRSGFRAAFSLPQRALTREKRGPSLRAFFRLPPALSQTLFLAAQPNDPWLGPNCIIVSVALSRRPVRPLGSAEQICLRKGSHPARDDGIVARLATVFRATLARSTWEESAAPCHGGYIVSATPFFIRSVCHLLRAAHAVGGGQTPAPASSAAEPFEELSRLDRGTSESCLR